MNIERIKKLESIAKQLISSYIFEELEDQEQIFGIITIVKVKISSDISYIDIYVSSLKNSVILTKTLAKHNYNIQKRFNKKINIRKLPRIRFRYDDSGEIGQNICETISKECS